MHLKIGNCRRILAVASVSVLALGGAACQTDGPEDVSGKTISFSTPKTAEPDEYHTRFVGEDAPTVTGARIISRDNQMQNEIFGFVTDYRKQRSLVFVELAPYFFGEESTEFIRNPENLLKEAKKSCKGTVGEPKSMRNVNGDFLMVSCETEDGAHGVLAYQGLHYEYNPYNVKTYRTIATFVYFSRTETEAKILKRFASMRVDR